jgi:hypothetical protein
MLEWRTVRYPVSPVPERNKTYTGTVRYRNKGANQVPESGILDYWTEMLNGALAKAVASASMPMPSYDKKLEILII